MKKRTSKIKRLASLIIITGLGVFSVVSVQAVPILQLYLEGATYDDADESWYSDYTDGDTLRIWAIGNVDGQGGKGAISNVRMSIAYDSADSPSFAVSSSSTGGYGGYTDLALTHDATFLQEVTDGSSPLLTGGTPIPSHGVYGAGTTWVEYGLGNFTEADDYAGDFTGSGLPTPALGYDVNVYEVVISGTGHFHIDLYDSIVSGNHVKAKFAPFSHDGAGSASVPDGGASLILMGMALTMIGGVRRILRR